MGYTATRRHDLAPEACCDVCGPGYGSDRVMLCMWCAEVEASFGGDLGNPLFRVVALTWRIARDLDDGYLRALAYPDAGDGSNR